MPQSKDSACQDPGSNSSDSVNSAEPPMKLVIAAISVGAMLRISGMASTEPSE
jgi:hypothetical protein